MRTVVVFLLGLLVMCGASAQSVQHASPFDGRGAAGEVIRFDPDHLQRPVILLFWATWCPYCKALMPHIQAVYDAAGKQGIEILAIDIKDDGDPAAELKARHMTFTLVRDGDPIAEQYGIKGTPGLLLIDIHGDIAYRRIGGDAPEAVESALRERLGLGPAKLETGRASARGADNGDHD